MHSMTDRLAVGDQTSTATVAQVAQRVACTEAEGPGRRYALWFQGCPLRCPQCCNPEMLPYRGGTAISVSDLHAELYDSHQKNELEGITFLGGEPFTHALAAIPLAQTAHELGLDVMVFSGFTIKQLRAHANLEVQQFLAEIDILVDGPYDARKPERQRRWIGSANQQIHFLSSRCRPDDERWHLPNTLEIRLQDGILTVNGFPANQARDLWQRNDLRRTSQ